MHEKLWLGNSNGREQYKDLDPGSSIILKLILKI
jgi:hypothetical protein